MFSNERARQGGRQPGILFGLTAMVALIALATSGMALVAQEDGKVFQRKRRQNDEQAEAASRVRSMNNLKHIAIAMYNYHDAHGSFPPAAVVGPDGKTTHSWRVALLPYLDEAKLYDEYRRDEPWDSEHNRKVLAKMPTVFRDPNAAENSTHASYFALVGKDTAFGDGKGRRIAEIVDGASNTLLAVDAQRDIPWTKPEDISVKPGEELPELGGHHGDLLLVLLCDGSVKAVKETQTDELKALIYINDTK